MSNSFVTPWTTTHHAPLSMELHRQDYWRGLPFPSPRELPYPRIEPISSALAGKFFTTELLVKPFGPSKDQYLTIPPKENYCLISNNIDNICLCLELHMDRVIQFVLLCVWILSFKRDSPQRQTNIVWYCLYVESKTYNKLVNKTNKKQTHREQISGYQWGEERGKGNVGVGNFKNVIKGLYEMCVKLLKIVKHCRNFLIK